MGNAMHKHFLMRVLPASSAMSVLLKLVAFLSVMGVATHLPAETPPEQEAAIMALRGWPSNLQKNRDGTVRFLRFSKIGVTDEHLKHITAFKQLDYLAVVTPTVTDTGLQHIAGLTNLDTLFLSDSQLTDAAMPAIQNLAKLERLYLDRTRVTDKGLANIAELQALTTLSLDGTAITDAGLTHIAKLQNLEVLNLTGTKVTDDGLKSLALLPQLKTLNLDETAITGSGFVHLGGLENLQVLGLCKTPLAAESLLPLAACKKLNVLLLDKTTANADDVAPLKTRLPKLTVRLSPTSAGSKNALQRLLAGEELRGPTGLENESPQTGTAAALETVKLDVRQQLNDATMTPDFQAHVLPLLGRLGCNGRSCHGSFQGQGGFTLSMFGYDFSADHKSLTGGDEPRVDLKKPDESLIIYKPTHGDEHGGGTRFEPDGWEHRLLRRWIAAGAPGLADGPSRIARFEVTPAEIVFAEVGETKQLKCVAVWENGTREDVTPLTRFRSNDDVIADVSADGMITCKSPGDTHIISSYDNAIFASQVLLPVSQQTGDRFPQVDTPTEIDRLVTTKLSRL